MWGVVFYAVSLLLYCTMKIVFNSTADFISAFASILGASGTFFAAFIAVCLFIDWREVHNQTAFKEVALNISSIFTKLKVKLIAINDVFSKLHDPEYKTSNGEYIIEKTSNMIESDIQTIGDILLELSYQIAFLKELSPILNNKTLDELSALIDDYMKIMDITRYRNKADHLSFCEDELELQGRLNDITNDVYKFLSQFIIAKSKNVKAL